MRIETRKAITNIVGPFMWAAVLLAILAWHYVFVVMADEGEYHASLHLSHFGSLLLAAFGLAGANYACWLERALHARRASLAVGLAFVGCAAAGAASFDFASIFQGSEGSELSVNVRAAGMLIFQGAWLLAVLLLLADAGLNIFGRGADWSRMPTVSDWLLRRRSRH